jgi:aldehyde dehydrogenase (NAD+)
MPAPPIFLVFSRNDITGSGFSKSSTTTNGYNPQIVNSQNRIDQGGAFVVSYHFAPIFAKQKAFFQTGQTQDVSFRLLQLQQLQRMIQENEPRILAGLKKDLQKPDLEAYAAEISFLLAEIQYVKKRLPKWVKPVSVKTMWLHFPAKSYILKEPYGVICIIGPWNYPFQLVLSPLVGAIAAGNCAMIKPSEVSPHTAAVLAELIPAYFQPEYITVIQGGVSETTDLLTLPFDYIFYTGNTRVGKIVMQAASQNLSPCTLELGGKNPCIVDEDVDLEKTAKRIVWGKFFNAGQTCIAPDYLLVHQSIKPVLLQKITEAITEFYGENPANSPDFARIVNIHHFERLARLLNHGDLIYGGQTDRQSTYIAPTVLDQVSWEDDIMQEEIFGPLLPVLSFESFDQMIQMIQSQPKPLALYFFSRQQARITHILQHLSAGNVCINGTLSQIISFTLPFGGIGHSGMGRYHGKYSFDTFTHQKSVLQKNFLWDNTRMYPPYRVPLKFFKRILKLLFLQ